MEKTIKSKSYFMVLASSIIINSLFMLKWYVGGELELSWSRRAAEEAEKVAAKSCSGHGRSYLDGLVIDGKGPICDCNTCYGGQDCSLFISDCAANADGGDPYFLEPFWMQHAASSALVVAGWHRMGYAFVDQSLISKELENQIRKLHAIVGNAVTDGKYIIFGVGATQLLNAAVYSLSPDNASSSPIRVLASIPYYPIYQKQTDLFQTVDYEFYGDVSLWLNSSDIGTNNFIEFVTSPNNPDGQLKKNVLHSPNSKAIYDRVYYWPHFTAIPASADEDIMLFSISKLTGHAGSRFGWAVVKDETVFQRMSLYLTLNTMGVSRDTQLRALKLLKVVLQGSGKEIFEFGYKTLSNRWEKLSKTLSVSKRFSLQSIGPQYCSYLQKTREPSPAYAWLKCEREEDNNCYAVLEAANIIGRKGSLFGADGHYVRLSLLKTEDDFDQLLRFLEKLVSNEGSIRTV